jgi:hypothetical protein
MLYGSETWTIKARDARRISAAGNEVREKNSRIHWDRLQNKYTNCKGVKKNSDFWTNYWNTRETGYNM